jgi:MoaA/NifB/PqqE/SkfB family radical SAM enzyme
MIQKSYLFNYLGRLLRHPENIFRLLKVLNAVRCHAITAVAIEINSQCNRKCAFCPNSMYNRGIAYMGAGLFHKIIDELKEIHYTGQVSFTLFNEPLLDKRLPNFVEYASKQLPGAYFHLFTNGDFLDISTWKLLRAAVMDFFLFHNMMVDSTITSKSY